MQLNVYQYLTELAESPTPGAGCARIAPRESRTRSPLAENPMTALAP